MLAGAKKYNNNNNNNDNDNNVKVIPVIVHLIAHYFPKHVVKIRKKIECTVPEIIDVFTFSHEIHFPPGIGRQSWAATHMASHMFCWTRVPQSYSVKYFSKWWVMQRYITLFVLHSIWKIWKAGRNFWNQRRRSLAVMLPNFYSLRIVWLLITASDIWRWEFHRNRRASKGEFL